ncbi:MAG: hypothetical protein SFY67_09090 [Candidatus Melainabacteria bacterium]|nr:hypothetical protein [Candidatus Melainabacteria bacterium]
MQKNSLALTALSLSMLISSVAPAFAISSQEATQAINQARILAPGTQLKINVAKGLATISTFRNEQANEKDTKIEALLMSKTLFDLGKSDIANVSIYFYEARDPKQFRSITITKGDVAAFGAGQISQDELLKSLILKQGAIQDKARMIENYLMLTSASRRKMQISVNGDEVNVTTDMPSDTPDREYKYEALRIAETALQRSDAGSVSRVNIKFFAVGGNKGQYKQVVVPVSQIQALDSEVQKALGSVALTKGVATLTAEDIDITPGPLQSERAMLLAGISELEQMGVGTAAFINALMAIEQKVKDQNTATLAKDVQSLNTSIETQKETYKAAKNSKPLHAKEDPHAAANLDSLKTNSKGSINRWALQFFPLPETDILKDPNGFLASSKKQFEDKIGGKKAEEQAQFAWALLWFAEVLKNNGRASEAASFERQAATVTATIQAKAKK